MEFINEPNCGNSCRLFFRLVALRSIWLFIRSQTPHRDPGSLVGITEILFWFASARVEGAFQKAFCNVVSHLRGNA